MCWYTKTIVTKLEILRAPEKSLNANVYNLRRPFNRKVTTQLKHYLLNGGSINYSGSVHNFVLNSDRDFKLSLVFYLNTELSYIKGFFYKDFKLTTKFPFCDYSKIFVSKAVM